MGRGSFTTAADHRVTPSVENRRTSSDANDVVASRGFRQAGIGSRRRSVLGIFAVAAGTALASRSRAAFEPRLTIGYVHWQSSVYTISCVFQPASGNGRAGAEVAIVDNNTIDGFMNQNFNLETIEVRTGDDPAAGLKTLIAKGIGFVVTDDPAADAPKLADAAAPHAVTIFNAGAHDDAIREENCCGNAIHSALSFNMLTDGLAQFLIWKRWLH